MHDAELDQLCINTMRFLAIDQVEQAKSGHPGAPMGAAAMAYVLWDRFLKHDPRDPAWPDRDRFVLSPGHASAMLYALLHLTGYDVALDDLRRFRQWGSRTPGHPELGHTPGVEATTGPLGQGFANGVGMAIAERRLARRYNHDGHRLIDHYTYAIVSDGDLQEGVASEAASLAGTLRLGKLVYLYDDNDISIEGNTDIAFAENVAQRSEAYGWHVVGPIDGMDAAAVEEAVRLGQAEEDRPTLIICQTIIGYGSPNKQGTGSVHGEPLGPEERVLTAKKLGWPYDEPFTVPPEAYAHMRKAVDRGRASRDAWRARLGTFREAYGEECASLEQDLDGTLPGGWDAEIDGLFDSEAKPIATREASGRVMNAIAARLHSFTGGSADLAPSTKTLLKEHAHYCLGEYINPNMHFGVREHAMGAIANGMALHGGLVPYTATFLVFSDYMRPAIRLGALQGQRVVYIFTHDSIGLGEDGPTHQPIEHLAALRAIPNLWVMRPADATETAEAWRAAIERLDGPTALVLSRQGLPVRDRSAFPPASELRKGAYTLWEASGGQAGAVPDALIIATGSEVPLALDAAKALAERGTSARVGSMPSWELFAAQPKAYRDSVLPPEVTARVSVEAASTFGWERFVGSEGMAVGVDRFGASAPAGEIYRELGITAERVAAEIEGILERR